LGYFPEIIVPIGNKSDYFLPFMHKTAHFSPEKTNFYTFFATFFTTYTAKSNLNPAKRAPGSG